MSTFSSIFFFSGEESSGAWVTMARRDSFPASLISRMDLLLCFSASLASASESAAAASPPPARAPQPLAISASSRCMMSGSSPRPVTLSNFLTILKKAR